MINQKFFFFVFIFSNRGFSSLFVVCKFDKTLLHSICDFILSVKIETVLKNPMNNHLGSTGILTLGLRAAFAKSHEKMFHYIY